ncbi:hypothetical protein [Amycolatopsis anabasis]|uniref:hypothetical protein n=1 Tax=Amycolatopsis anabasis TaxID=1840409 RepID=UPI00131DF507|nr:hypothetical protein [Amycolatopsis anabasis]
MATVEDTVRTMIRDSPALFANRTQALHFLFCVLGNGYAWRHGELVETRPLPPQSDEDILEQIPPVLAHDTAFLADAAARNRSSIRVRACADALAQTPGELDEAPYPPNLSTLLLNRPLDIRPDWLEAAREIARTVLPRWRTGEHFAPQYGPITPWTIAQWCAVQPLLEDLARIL